VTRALLALCAVLGTACASHVPAPPTPADVSRPLAGLAAQRIVVTPVFAVQGGDALGWAASIARPRAMLRDLDSIIVAEFAARGMRTRWYFAPDLEHSFQLNPTYAPDPHALAVEPLRGRLDPSKPYGDPLATQLRTIIALRDEGRFVLLPVEVRFERDGPGPNGRAVLKLVLVDARTVEYRWTRDVSSDPAPAFGSAVMTSLAAHFADLVISP
jgi:hypothetical protein